MTRATVCALATASVLAFSACGSAQKSAGSHLNTTTTAVSAQKPSTSANSVASQALTGMGATVEAMKAAHGADTGSGGICSAANSCFGPGLSNNDSGSTFLFTNVIVTDGLVTGYQQNFPTDTSLATAESEIMRWMPSDATIGTLSVDHNGGSCGLVNITSPTLGKVFSDPKIGDPQGIIGVSLEHLGANQDPAYDPNDIETAVLGVVPINPSANC